MPRKILLQPYLETSVVRDRLPEPMLDLLGELHWNEKDEAKSGDPAIVAEKNLQSDLGEGTR